MFTILPRNIQECIQEQHFLTQKLRRSTGILESDQLIPSRMHGVTYISQRPASLVLTRPVQERDWIVEIYCAEVEDKDPCDQVQDWGLSIPC